MPLNEETEPLTNIEKKCNPFFISQRIYIVTMKLTCVRVKM